MLEASWTTTFIWYVEWTVIATNKHQAIHYLANLPWRRRMTGKRTRCPWSSWPHNALRCQTRQWQSLARWICRHRNPIARHFIVIIYSKVAVMSLKMEKLTENPQKTSNILAVKVQHDSREKSSNMMMTRLHFQMRGVLTDPVFAIRIVPGRGNSASSINYHSCTLRLHL